MSPQQVCLLKSPATNYDHLLLTKNLNFELASFSEAIDDPGLMYTPTVVEDDSGSEQVSGSEVMGQQHVALISQDGTQQVSDYLNKFPQVLY